MFCSKPSLEISSKMQGRTPETKPETIEMAMATVRHLPVAVRQKMQKLYAEGTIRPGDLDSRCILNLQALQEPLQMKVLQHIERDRVFFTNARSKAGFLVGACECLLTREKAKQIAES